MFHAPITRIYGITKLKLIHAFDLRTISKHLRSEIAISSDVVMGRDVSRTRSLYETLKYCDASDGFKLTAQSVKTESNRVIFQPLRFNDIYARDVWIK